MELGLYAIHGNKQIRERRRFTKLQFTELGEPWILGAQNF